jgi:uncharacterized protein (TIGR02145 family)
MKVIIKTTSKITLAIFILIFGSCKKNENNPVTQTTTSGNLPTVTKSWLNSNLNYGSISDIDGNTYATIKIGTQEWMAENLRTTKYRDGTPIANVTDPNQWYNLTTGAWAHYNNDNSYEIPYGKLYNWYAVVDQRNLCPSGWHVPSDAEWDILIGYLGGENVAGGKMKSIGTQYWLGPNTDATNERGFSGLPGGGDGGIEGKSGGWWSTTVFTNSQYNINAIWTRSLNYNDAKIGKYFYDRKNKFSIRCIKD